jgi:hypothetical protein
VCSGGVSGQITLPLAWTDRGEPSAPRCLSIEGLAELDTLTRNLQHDLLADQVLGPCTHGQAALGIVSAGSRIGSQDQASRHPRNLKPSRARMKACRIAISQSLLSVGMMA